MPQDTITNADLKKYKRDFAHTYSFGVFPTLELLEHHPQHLLKVLLSSKGTKNEGVQKIGRICRQNRIPAEVNDKLIERLAPNANSYAIGVFRKYESRLNAAESHVVLVNPSDMGNLGTIIRTMAGFGTTNLGIVRPGVDIFDPRVIRSSMGALFHISFQYFDTFDLYRSAFSHHLYPFMTDGRVPLQQATFEPPYALIFGNEGAGLPDDYRSLGTSITIPHTDRIDSLNLPISVGIALYEATKGTFA
jgi:TrmH family RNA methyltransferase